MNKAEKRKIARIRSALAEVPYAQDGRGTRTASTAGFVAFHTDMRVVKDACEAALYQLLCPDPDLSPDEQEQEFDETMRRAERYIASRKEAGWK